MSARSNGIFEKLRDDRPLSARVGIGDSAIPQGSLVSMGMIMGF